LHELFQGSLLVRARKMLQDVL